METAIETLSKKKCKWISGQNKNLSLKVILQWFSCKLHSTVSDNDISRCRAGQELLTFPLSDDNMFWSCKSHISGQFVSQLCPPKSNVFREIA